MCQGSANLTLNIRSLGSGPNVVLLHGWGMNSGAFAHWLPYLTDDFTVTLVDLPGFGINSDVLPNPYSLSSLVDCVAPVIPKNAVVVGWSLGGLVAQGLALAEHVNLAGLVTVASTPYFVQNNGWSGIRPDVLAGFARQLARSFDKTLERFLAIQAMGSDNPRSEIRELKANIQQFPAPSPIALDGGLTLLSTADLREHIAKIRIPTLRIYGKRDSLVPVSAVDMIHQLQPHADNVVLCEAAHAPFMSHPDKMAQMLGQFIDRLQAVNDQLPKSYD